MGDSICGLEVLDRAGVVCSKFFECNHCKHKLKDPGPMRNLCDKKNCYGKINLFKPLLPPSPINLLIIILIIIFGYIYLFSRRLSKLGGILLVFTFIFFILGYIKFGPFSDFWIKSLENCPSIINNILCNDAEGKRYLYLDNRRELGVSGPQCINTVSRYDSCEDATEGTDGVAEYPFDRSPRPGCNSDEKGGCSEGEGRFGCSKRFLPWQGIGADCKKCCKL